MTRPILPLVAGLAALAALTTLYAAVLHVQNAAIGTHMQGVKPGAIKALRIVESPEKRNWSQLDWGGQGAQAPGMNWLNFENKRILGTVPVEPDGSAYFEAPGNTFVFFQAHDGLLDPVERNGGDVLGFQRGRRLQLSRHADINQLQ